MALGRRSAQHFPKRLALLHGLLQERFDGAVSDAARGRVDDAQERGFVVRVIEHAQVGEDVFYFAAVVKRLAANQHVRNFFAAELQFKRSRLLVGAAQNGDVAALDGGVFQSQFDIGDGASSLVGFVLALHDGGCEAAETGGTQHFVVTVAVESDQAVGEFENGVAGAVVVFEPDDGGGGPIVLESQDVFDLRARQP